jgi:uncharacterized protein
MSKIKDTLKQIIVENQDLLPLSLIKRNLDIERIPKKATIVLGVRRCGKTSLLLEYLGDLLAKGLDKTCICHIDFSDDRLLTINESEPAVISEAYYELYPQNHNKKVYFLFDEIQYVKNWELLVNRLQNTENCEVNITGSSSKLLLNETSTVLGGRKLGWELFCYSYEEFLRAKGVEINVHSKAFRDQQANLFSDYLNIGGFPEAMLFTKSFSRQAFFQNIANDIVFRDIVLRHDISKPEVLKTMVLVLFSMMGCPLTESKLYQRLAGMQVKISKPTMSEYFEYILESYCFFSVPIRSYNLAVQAVNAKKIYCADHALAASMASLTAENAGQRLENIVFLQLRRQTDKVFYYKTQSGFEVDFAVGPDNNIQLIQVCANLSNQDTLEREKRSLIEAMKELNQNICTIVTLDEERTIECDNKLINIVPAWKYLLQPLS